MDRHTRQASENAQQSLGTRKHNLKKNKHNQKLICTVDIFVPQEFLPKNDLALVQLTKQRPVRVTITYLAITHFLKEEKPRQDKTR